MMEPEVTIVAGYLFTLVLIAAYLRFRYVHYWQTRESRIFISGEKKPYRYFRFLSLTGLMLFVIGLIHYVFVLERVNFFAPYWARLFFITLLTLVLITELRYHLFPLPRKRSRILNIIFGILITVLGIWFNQLYMEAASFPAKNACVTLDLPFRGKWIATAAGATGLTNYHNGIRNQWYAVDLIRFGDQSKLFREEGITNEESYTFGADIVSPVNGKVIQVTEDVPDQPERNLDKPVGNSLLIQFQDSLFLQLAHLRQHSIMVKPGDGVTAGQKLAEVGNSGDTVYPHLHLHVQGRVGSDTTEPKSYPFRFRKFKRMRYVFWTTETDQFLLTNDIIRPVDTRRDGSEKRGS